MYGIFGRCYQLNKGLVAMSYCYPDVLMHKAALKRLRELNGPSERMGENTVATSIPPISQKVSGFHDRAPAELISP